MKSIQRLALIKVYFNRSAQYISLANFGLIMTVNLKLWGVPSKYQIPIILLGVICMISIGWADTKFNFYKEEQNHIMKQNPIIMEILKEVKKNKNE
jgi:hypothetical protein